MAKQQLYAIGILKTGNMIKYVTEIGEHHTAKWQDGKEAKYFSKAFVLDVCQGFAWNGIAAIPILKQEFITLRNEVAENE